MTPAKPASPNETLSKHQLTRILDEAMIYQCVCPAQVARTLLELRQLYQYQRECSDEREADLGVHARIMESIDRAHAELEGCLVAVLQMESWDMETMTMPEGLRQRRDAAIRADD
ncbi:MAG: hypothetical protein KDH20_13320 [Rhodocyclaceae bacterium]|nr:hypothetical protein [Rhodocyclaceae bacterium]